jgi:hypothetical protein
MLFLLVFDDLLSLKSNLFQREKNRERNNNNFKGGGLPLAEAASGVFRYPLCAVNRRHTIAAITPSVPVGEVSCLALWTTEDIRRTERNDSPAGANSTVGK